MKVFCFILEEVCDVDLFIYVVDYLDLYYKIMMKMMEEMLKVVGVEDVLVIYVYNKVDLIEGEIYFK